MYWFLLQSFSLLFHHFSGFRNGLWKDLNHRQTDFIQRLFLFRQVTIPAGFGFQLPDNFWKTQVSMFQAEVCFWSALVNA